MHRIASLKVLALLAFIALMPRRDSVADPINAYQRWLRAGNHEKTVSAYAGFLRRHGVENVLPMPQLLSASRDWRHCDVEP